MLSDLEHASDHDLVEGRRDRFDRFDVQAAHREDVYKLLRRERRPVTVLNVRALLTNWLVGVDAAEIDNLAHSIVRDHWQVP